MKKDLSGVENLTGLNGRFQSIIQRVTNVNSSTVVIHITIQIIINKCRSEGESDFCPAILLIELSCNLISLCWCDNTGLSGGIGTSNNPKLQSNLSVACVIPKSSKNA